MEAEIARHHIVVAEIEKPEHADPIGRNNENYAVGGVLLHNLRLVEHHRRVVEETAAVNIEEYRALSGGAVPTTLGAGENIHIDAILGGVVLRQSGTRRIGEARGRVLASVPHIAPRRAWSQLSEAQFALTSANKKKGYFRVIPPVNCNRLQLNLLSGIYAIPNSKK